MSTAKLFAFTSYPAPHAWRVAWGDVVANVAGAAPLTVGGALAGVRIDPADLGSAARIDIRATAQRVTTTAGGETMTVQVMAGDTVLNALLGPAGAGAVLQSDTALHYFATPTPRLVFGTADVVLPDGPIVLSIRINGGNPQTGSARFLSLSATAWCAA
jgi:hypothetical protein